MDTSPKWILIIRSQYYPLMPVWLYSGETSCYDDEVGHKEGHQTLRRAFSVAGPMFLTIMRCTNPRTLSLFSLCIGRVKRRNNYPQKFSFQGSSQVTQRVISKGDICTFNTSNQKEKHNTMKRKKTQWGEKKPTKRWGGMIELNILKQTSISEHVAQLQQPQKC